MSAQYHFIRGLVVGTVLVLAGGYLVYDTLITHGWKQEGMLFIAYLAVIFFGVWRIYYAYKKYRS